MWICNMGPWVFHMCNVSQVSHEKAEKMGRLFCQLNQSCWKLHEIGRSSLRIFPCLATGWWGISASWTKVAWNCMKLIDPVSEFSLFGCYWGGGGGGSQMKCSMMHEIWFCKVVTWHNVRSVSHQKAGVGGGGLSGQLATSWGFACWIQ